MSKQDITIASIDETDSSVASLEEFSEGDWVEYSDGNYGLVVGVVSGPLDWPTGDEETEKVGEDAENVYVVARASGGSKPFTADELESASRDDAVGDTDEMPDEPEEDIDGAEMASAYRMVSDGRVAELHERPVSELINIPGVDDPHVGFDSWPDSWRKSPKPARLIALDAWSSMGGTWTGCFAEIGSRRLCAAFKDEILGTERWRNRF
jgi:hypothetical protein